MKKIIFLIVLVCFLPKVYAQDFTPSFKENTPTVAVSISPFSFAINKAEIGPALEKEPSMNLQDCSIGIYA